MVRAGDAAEQHFVREALLALGSDRPGLRDAARAVRSWDRVLAIAAAGSVAESIWSGVSLRGVEREIPEPARTSLREAHAGATARNALLLSEAAEIQAAFTAAGIESVILKGPGLLVAHYPDIGARHVADVDILVRGGEVARRANAIVRARGGQPKLKPLVPMEEAEDAHHHLEPLVTPRGVVFEIHTRVPWADPSDPDVENIFGHTRSVSWQGWELRIPSAPDLAVMLCRHVFDYHGGLKEYLARHLADMAVLMGTGAAVWSDLEVRVGSRSSLVALTASRFLVEDGRVGSAARRHVLGVRTRVWVNLITRQEPRVVMRAVFPPRSFMSGRYGVHPTSRMLPLLYLWRPVRGAWRFVTGR